MACARSGFFVGSSASGSPIRMESFFLNLTLVCVTRLVVDISYVGSIAPRYEYLYGFEVAPGDGSVALSWIVLIFMSALFLICVRGCSFSALLTTALFMLSVVPMTTIFAYQGVTEPLMFFFILYWVVLVLAFRIMPSPQLPVGCTKFRKLILRGVAIVLALAVVFVSWKYAGLRLTFDLSSSVYDLRLAARDMDVPTVLRYLLGTSKIVVPILVLYALQSRRWLVAGLLSLVQFLSFSFDGSKATLFYLLLAFVLLLIAKKPSMTLVIGGVCVMVVAGLVSNVLVGSTTLMDFGTRRMMLIPAVIHCDYFDFFSANPPDLYVQSVFSKLGFTSEYSSDIARMIGLVYHGSPDMSANNGLFSDAVANLDLAGCVVMPLVLMFLVKLIDGASSGLSAPILMASTVIVAFVLISSSFFTALLTHGILVLILVLCFMPRVSGRD